MEVPDYYEFAEKDWPIQEKGFAAMIRNIDNSMGMIFTKLKDLGIDEKTLVIFCSDNGPHQEGGHVMEFFNSNGNFRGMKRDMYEGGVRTPFIARWPGVIKPNTFSGHIAAFWDVLPTFCDIAGVKKPENTDGISFLPAMLGNVQTKTHNYLYWEFFEQGGKQAILKGDWKAIRLKIRGKAEQQVTELYNLKSDPSETNNVADKNPDLIKRFNELFITAREEFKVTPLFSEDDKKVETHF
jgi:arylsulfatase A-like enzyme